jgi:hypothetical protein
MGDCSFPIFFAREIEHPIERVEINDGTYEIKNDPAYSYGSIIPNDTFTKIDNLAFDFLMSSKFDNSKTNKNFIGILNLNKIVKSFFNIGIHSCNNINQINDISKSNLFKMVFEKFTGDLNEFFEMDGEIQYLGINFKSPNLKTSTVDRNLNLRIGLHLDSWDRKKLNDRENSRNRICINLGKEVRHFIFLNKKIIELIDDLEIDNFDLRGGSELGRLYLRKYPNQQITKLNIYPGEAYIAPTENIIHDATTLNKAFPDITLSIIGNFWVKKDLLR